MNGIGGLRGRQVPPSGSGKQQDDKNKWRRLIQTFLLYAVIFLLGLFILGRLSDEVPILNGQQTPEIPLTQVIQEVKDEKVEKITVNGQNLTLEFKDGREARSRKDTPTQSLLTLLREAGVEDSASKVAILSKQSFLDSFGGSIVGNIVSILSFLIIFTLIMRVASRGAVGDVFDIGKSSAKLFSNNGKKEEQITFDDVAGVEEAKQELREVVDFFKHPEKYRKLGARIPRGVLLVGPAGVGKTLLAKAVANEAEVPFYSMAGSEFIEMLVGVGASRVRDLFSRAKKSAPALVFIDEIETIGKQRGSVAYMSHGEQEQTLNQILTEMDGFTPSDNVIVLAASVAGDTPILVRDPSSGESRLKPIRDVVDAYYTNDEEGVEKPAHGLQVLGFDKREKLPFNLANNLYFKASAFKDVHGVFRHKVDEIYEIDYLGGQIRATGSHSVFVRTRKGIETKAVAQLEEGDFLVDLPYKVNRTRADQREIRAHNFGDFYERRLPIYPKNSALEEKYQYALEKEGVLSQEKIGAQIGMAQATVGNWQRGINLPRGLSGEYYQHELPEEVAVTPNLMRLFGYYAAEGYARKGLDFCVGTHEDRMRKDIKFLMKAIFDLVPDDEHSVNPTAVNIRYYASPLDQFFARYTGKGAHNKHVPAFLFEAPYEYFVEFLRGLARGDGYQDDRGRLEITSVSQRLILELNWLCRMHGLKSYVGSFTAQEGRRIGEEGQPLVAVKAYRLGLGKFSNPFNGIPLDRDRNNAFRPVVREVRKVPYDGYVYDLCGCDNEAFFGGENPILLHNTNRPDILDPALTRPGRFDRRITLQLPDIEGRKAIIGIHKKDKPLAEDVDLEQIAQRTVGFSGADIENMLNEAAIMAAREESEVITRSHIEEAATKVKLGPEKRRLQSEEDKRITAYHEAGHALVAMRMEKVDPVHRVSIVSRGFVLGFTQIVPEQDRFHHTRTRLSEQLAVMLGGRAAEELVFNDMTVGAGNDLEQANLLAKKMVTEFGMSELGPLSFKYRDEEAVWEGRVNFGQTQYSEKMAARIDAEIEKIIDGAYKKAQKVLQENREVLDRLADRLVEVETIEQEELERLLQ